MGLWRWVEVRPAEDIRVAEGRLAIRLRRGPRDRRATGPQEHAPGVYLRTISGIARVIPHRGAIGARRGRVDVVTQELAHQVVLAGAAWVTRRAAMQL